MDKEQNTPQNNGNSESDDKQAQTVREPRCTTISFRVSRTQREHIGRLADKCGMTLSDYVLARSYNYLPKSRLTPEQEAALPATYLGDRKKTRMKWNAPGGVPVPP